MLVQLDDRFPNLIALGEGRVSGRISEWPRLKREARDAIALLRSLIKAGDLLAPPPAQGDEV